jgi:arsenite-transporting ATPase
VLKAVRPIANRVAPVELPSDDYFANIKELFGRLAGVDQLLGDPALTSVRLVTNAERVVLRETQRAFVYFSLHGLTVDTVIVNRVLPAGLGDPFFRAWQATHERILAEMEAYFAPVPLKRVPLFENEVLGVPRLQQVAEQLYGNEDPAALVRRDRPFHFEQRRDGRYEVRLALPFATKGEVELFKKNDELVVTIGSLRRHIGLPTSMAGLRPGRARLADGMLTIEMESAS